MLPVYCLPYVFIVCLCICLLGMGVTLRFMYNGHFYMGSSAQIMYRRSKEHIKEDVDLDLISRIELVSILSDDVGVNSVRELWYVQCGETIDKGLTEISGDADICSMIERSVYGDTFYVYVVQQGELSPSDLRGPKSVMVNPGPNISSPSQRIGADSNKSPRVASKLPVQKVRLPELLTDVNLGSESDEDEGDEDIGGSETSDAGSDFQFVPSDADDDDIWAEYVDETVAEDLPLETVEDDQLGSYFQEAAESIEVDLEDESDGFRSLSDSDGNTKPRYVDFNPLVDFKKPVCLKVGMRFGSNEIFRRALRQFAIQQGGDFYYLHNDLKKVSAYCKNRCDCEMKYNRKKCVCKKTLCGWRAVARKMSDDGTFQLKTLNPSHDCAGTDRNTKVTSKWLAEKYLEHYRDDPKWSLKGFMSTVRREYTVNISYAQAYRARVRALLMTQGDATAQFGKVWDYAATLVKWSHGTSAFVKVCIEQPEKPLFQRLYVCLDACKNGFMSGCRPIIGLDGCHLRGVYTGQLLCAVGKDGNDNLFPIAFAVVEIENKDTWCWFLDALMQDLRQGTFTFISDRQKGLVEALNSVVPDAEARVCVKHLWENFKTKWSGKAFRDGLWYAARAANKADFDEAMDHMKGLSEDAHRYLVEANPRTWSRHGFGLTCKSDMQLNNACESFNNYIRADREKPILSMCESIRRKLMRRFISKKAGMTKHNGSLTPKIQKRLDELKEQSIRGCQAFWGGGDTYEVDNCGRTFVVDLSAKSCGCNKWDLTGIPCIHAISCCLLRRYKIADYVHEFYTKDAYLRAYNNIVQTIPGEQQWEKSEMPAPEPPKCVVQPGRPKKARRKAAGEDKSNKSRRNRSGKKNKCSHCGIEGHTKRKCKNPPKEPEHPVAGTRKAGRPKNPHTVNVSLLTNNKRRRLADPSPPVPPAIQTSMNFTPLQNRSQSQPLPSTLASTQRSLTSASSVLNEVHHSSQQHSARKGGTNPSTSKRTYMPQSSGANSGRTFLSTAGLANVLRRSPRKKSDANSKLNAPSKK